MKLNFTNVLEQILKPFDMLQQQRLLLGHVQFMHPHLLKRKLKACKSVINKLLCITNFILVHENWILLCHLANKNCIRYWKTFDSSISRTLETIDATFAHTSQVNPAIPNITFRHMDMKNRHDHSSYGPMGTSSHISYLSLNKAKKRPNHCGLEIKRDWGQVIEGSTLMCKNHTFMIKCVPNNRQQTEP